MKLDGLISKNPNKLIKQHFKQPTLKYYFNYLKFYFLFFNTFSYLYNNKKNSNLR